MDVQWKRLIFISLFLACYFLCAFFFMHFIHPEIDFKQYPLSWYLVMDYGWLLRLGFIAFGLAEIILGVYLFQQGNRAAAFYCLAGMGAVLSGILIIDHDTQSTSLQEYLHNYGAALQFIGFPIVAFYFFFKLKTPWIKILSLFSSVLTGFFFAQMLVKLGQLNADYLKIYGLLQRLTILCIVSYTAVVLVVSMSQRSEIEH